MIATIGFFDGVHKGHQFVVRQVAEEAQRRGMQAVVVTFDRPPREVVTGKPCPLLTTLRQKQSLIVKAGADRCEVLHFDREMAQLPARDFMRTVLKEKLHLEVLMLGYDNRFGHRTPDSHEGFDDYLRYAGELGIELIRLPEKACPDAHVRCSSSSVRKALSEGDVSLAGELLGRPYSIAGRVVHGRGEGRRLDFPTANLSPETVETILPAAGVYAVSVKVDDENGPESRKLGMMNIGTRPTYDGGALSLEAHVFDFTGDLYDRQLTVEFLRRIRDEQAFSSPEALRRQLEKDKNQIISTFKR
ncbi:MAG: riboflavin biosynthesis protein RibF [Prevotella sp.]|nr:riboflavin biosynthesis protein RibF [Prevotella sp.]